MFTLSEAFPALVQAQLNEIVLDDVVVELDLVTEQFAKLDLGGAGPRRIRDVCDAWNGPRYGSSRFAVCIGPAVLKWHLFEDDVLLFDQACEAAKQRRLLLQLRNGFYCVPTIDGRGQIVCGLGREAVSSQEALQAVMQEAWDIRVHLTERSDKHPRLKDEYHVQSGYSDPSMTTTDANLAQVEWRNPASDDLKPLTPAECHWLIGQMWKQTLLQQDRARLERVLDSTLHWAGLYEGAEFNLNLLRPSGNVGRIKSIQAQLEGAETTKHVFKQYRQVCQQLEHGLEVLTHRTMEANFRSPGVVWSHLALQ
eukprot:1381648-Amphidinium_carterae.1